jgi:hypothetical protein
MSAYPECDKLSAASATSQQIGNFLDWLEEKKFVRFVVPHAPEVDEHDRPVFRNVHGELIEGWKPSDWYADHSCNDYKEALRRERVEFIEQMLKPNPQGDTEIPLRVTREKLLAEFFEIDLNKVEEERRAMLDACRVANHDGG